MRSWCNLDAVLCWPDVFADSAEIIAPHYDRKLKPAANPTGTLERRPYSMTNHGLEFTVTRLDVPRLTVPHCGLPTILLNCWKISNDSSRSAVTISMRKSDHSWRRMDEGRITLSKLGNADIRIFESDWYRNSLHTTARLVTCYNASIIRLSWIISEPELSVGCPHRSLITLLINQSYLWRLLSS